MDIRCGDWLETYTGLKFYPLDPRPEDVCIEDIAHALSNQCRFAGHTSGFYSVAQHSVLVCELTAQPCKKWSLLHDASEAYLVDLPSPIKKYSALGLAYQEIEARVMEAICAHFGLPEAMPDEVHKADREALVHEARQFMHGQGRNWPRQPNVAPLQWEIVGVSPDRAEREFMEAFHTWGS